VSAGAAAPCLPAAADLRDVGPRDGLQVERPLTVDERARLIEALVAAGLRRIEVGSFVSPRAVPAMAGTDRVLERVGGRDAFQAVALVPNVRGAELALAAGADALTVTVSASATYNRRNVGMTIDESLGQLERIAELARDATVPVDVVLSCAYGSPYEGEIAPGEVARLVDASRRVGAAAITLADTTGMATPRGVGEVAATVGSDVGVHFHETRGTGLVNVYAALQEGITEIDASLGGLGGSPFADGAAGNVATEDVVHLLDDLGVETGVDLGRLLEASALLRDLLGRPLPSAVAASGPRIPVGARHEDR